MDKTININLGGTLFQIDEDAFKILRDYLQAINIRFGNTHGGLETIEDIESRIAEIFQSQKGLAGAITKANVEAMIGIIGKPEDFDLNEPVQETQPKTNQKRRLYRNPDDVVISGVCSGLGGYLDTDPVLFRILFVLFTLFFGVGLFVYIALWIALPSANTDLRRRELYGDAYHRANSSYRQPDGTYSTDSQKYVPRYQTTSKIGNAFNEVFRAIGRVLFIFMRIVLIVIGVFLVLSGFLAILCFVMIFVFKYPGSFTHEGIYFNLGYLPDFLNYVVNPSVTPWIIALTTIAFVLPVLAIIYWGVKMIFWFKAKDGWVSLAGLVLWVMTIAALAIILFNEGVSFAETASTFTESVLPKSFDTLYVVVDKKVADLKYDKELGVPDNDYNIFIVDSVRKIYVRPYLSLKVSDDKVSKVMIDKRSSGRTKSDALNKSESIIYNYRISRDTVFLNEYFTLPEGSKWSADFVNIDLVLPENKILYFDNSVKELFHRYIEITRVNNEVTRSLIDYKTEPWELKGKYWVISDEGLTESEKTHSRHK